MGNAMMSDRCVLCGRIEFRKPAATTWTQYIGAAFIRAHAGPDQWLTYQELHCIVSTFQKKMSELRRHGWQFESRPNQPRDGQKRCPRARDYRLMFVPPEHRPPGFPSIQRDISLEERKKCAGIT